MTCPFKPVSSLVLDFFFFFLSIFFGLFAFNGQVSRDRQETGGRERGMTCRIRPLSVGFKPGSPAARTVASTHGAGALPAELCSTPGFRLLNLFLLIISSQTGNQDKIKL